jgi:phosphoribosylaminoimidazolecarboxamide formyltransferase / IMP cyclohydrolase
MKMQSQAEPSRAKQRRAEPSREIIIYIKEYKYILLYFLKMKTALISVFDKTDILPLAYFLLENDFLIISSGGTYKHLCDNIFNERIITVESYTGFPEILGGRVKTLHPKIAAGILSTDKTKDVEDLQIHNIFKIDLVICNLYPFKDVISKKHTTEDAIENIDIGGVTLIRAAFKNYHFVSILTNPRQYNYFINNSFQNLNGTYNLTLAVEAMQHISNYDIEITEYFSNNCITYDKYTLDNNMVKLKYGCNPHQNNAFVTSIKDIPFPIQVLNGKPGYINFMDAIQSWCLVTELSNLIRKPVVASFKHTTPAGVGTPRPLNNSYNELYDINVDTLNSTSTAFIRARTADPLSSFGDFIAISGTVDDETAQLIKREVSDGIIALNYSPKAFEILKSKKNGNYIILQGDPYIIDNLQNKNEKRELNGVCFKQNINNEYTNDKYFQNVPTEKKELLENTKEDLIIANTTLKYTPSNSIVYAYDGQVIGVGAGQQNRVDCVKLAGEKAKKWFLLKHELTLQVNEKLKNTLKRQDRVNALTQFIDIDYNRIVDFKHDYYSDTEINYLNNWMGQYISPNYTLSEINFISRKIKNDYLKEVCNFSLASDAFFPFRDSIDNAFKYGVKNIIQPGGSLADEEVIKVCNEYGIYMTLSGIRVFTH